MERGKSAGVGEGERNGGRCEVFTNQVITEPKEKESTACQEKALHGGSGRRELEGVEGIRYRVPYM